MKKFIKSFILVIAFAGVSFAQDGQVAGSQGSDALIKSKASGDYSFVMPTNLTAENIADNSKYYTHYFSIEFDEGSHTAMIHLLENSAKNRFVIRRFLTACGVNSIEVDDANLDLDAFTEKYLQ